MSLKIQLQYKGEHYEADLHEGFDLSIPLEEGPGHVSAWYVDPIRIEPVRMGEWIGEVRQGASVNFRNIFFNPHGHGTHTESVGHISAEIHSVNKLLKSYFFFAEVISVDLQSKNEDLLITKSEIEKKLKFNTEALVIRTLPNDPGKLTRQYSKTNPPYLEHEAAIFLRERGIFHLLLDLPSVDREDDGGHLLAHHAFWDYPHATRMGATITEFIYVQDNIEDGFYLVNLQTAPFENDASPSRPVLFKLMKKD